MPRATLLNFDALNLFKRKFLAGEIVQLGRARRFVISDGLGVLQGAAVLQVSRNPGSTKGMTAGGGEEAGGSARESDNYRVKARWGRAI